MKAKLVQFGLRIETPVRSTPDFPGAPTPAGACLGDGLGCDNETQVRVTHPGPGGADLGVFLTAPRDV